MPEKLTCTLCEEPPFVKYYDEEGAYWVCLDHAAKMGCPTAIQIKATAWLEGKLEKVLPVEGVQ